MKRNTRKGFTGIELVIVIAIIAILAASLIPAFGGLFDSAHRTADIQLAKNLNTALLPYKISGDLESLSDVLEAAKKEGYLISNLNPTANGCYLVWEDSTHQLLLVDVEAGNEVLYAVDDNYPQCGPTWRFITSDPEAREYLKGKGYYVENLVATASDLSAILALGGTQTIYFDESVVLDNDHVLKVDQEGANIVVNLGSSSVTTDTHLSKMPFHVVKGKLTINGGVLGGSGDVTNEYGSFAWAVGVDNDADLILNNVTINTDASGVTGSTNTDGDIYIEINNSTIKAGGYVVHIACGQQGGKAVLNNVTASAQVGFFPTQGTSIEINGGNYTATTMFKLQPNEGASITITDGTFNGKTLSELGVDGIKGMCEGDYEVVKNGDVYTITFD